MKDWLLKNAEKAKLTAGGGLITLVVYLHGDVTGKVESVKADTMKYVDSKIEEVQSSSAKDVDRILNNQKMILNRIEVMDQRIYKLNQGK